MGWLMKHFYSDSLDLITRAQKIKGRECDIEYLTSTGRTSLAVTTAGFNPGYVSTPPRSNSKSLDSGQWTKKSRQKIEQWTVRKKSDTEKL